VFTGAEFNSQFVCLLLHLPNCSKISCWHCVDEIIEEICSMLSIIILFFFRKPCNCSMEATESKLPATCVDPVSSLTSNKRRLNNNNTCCFFCQSDSGNLRIGSEDGKARVKTVAEQRRNLGDTQYADVIERIRIILDDEHSSQTVVWHKDCYSTYTSETQLERLSKKRQHCLAINTAPAVTSDHSTPTVCALGPRRRSSQTPIDWSLCMFCQNHSNKSTHRVETMPCSDEITERAKYDPVMSLRLSGVLDLIAAEGCYHLACLVTFNRRYDTLTKVVDPAESGTDICLMEIVRDLANGLSCGRVYDMGDVWAKYESMCGAVGHYMPRRYLSRRTTFYEVVQQLLGSNAKTMYDLCRMGH